MTRTAVAASPQPPYEELLAVIDRMTVVEMARFVVRLHLLLLSKALPKNDRDL